VASEPLKLRNVEFTSRIENKPDKQFTAGPFEEEIVLTNCNFPTCVVVVTISTRAAGIRINGKKTWKSKSCKLGGGIDKPGKRVATLNPTFTFERTPDGGEETFKVRVKWRRERVKKFAEIGEMEYSICVR
jgi:hypothetical protein